MDKQEYLNQISASNRPTKQSGGFLSSGLVKFGIGAVIALIAIIIAGACLSGGTTNSERVLMLQTRIETTADAISDYQSKIKSSDLRSYNATLSSILSATSVYVENYLDNLETAPELSSKNEAEEETAAEELSTSLFEAKINGYLDRTFAREMAYEIMIIMTYEQEIVGKLSDENFSEQLTSSYNSLDNLYEKFNNFSGTNK